MEDAMGLYDEDTPACHECGSSEWTPIADGTDRIPGGSGLASCDRCEHVFNPHVPARQVAQEKALSDQALGEHQRSQKDQERVMKRIKPGVHTGPYLPYGSGHGDALSQHNNERSNAAWGIPISSDSEVGQKMMRHRIQRAVDEDHPFTPDLDRLTHTNSRQGTSMSRIPIAKVVSLPDLRKTAHDSGDGQTIYHCGRSSERYWTIDGLKTLGETVGTVQHLLVNTGAGGVWREAMIHSFGEQPLLKVTLKRNKQRKVTYWTPGHRWLVKVRRDETRTESRIVTTQDLKPGNVLSSLLPKSRIGASSPSQFGIAHGITYGDGTRAALGSTLNLWGEKDAQLLRYFSESSQDVVKTSMGVLGVHITGMPAFFKERPSLDESVPYLYGWLAGYFAADGTVSSIGGSTLYSASRETLEYVQVLSTRLGIGTYEIGSQLRNGFGDEPSTIFKLPFIGSTLRPDFFLIKEHRERYQTRLDRGFTERIAWTVESVKDEGMVEEVFCPRVPEYENFVLDGWINTKNCPMCGSGQVVARSDRTVECQYCHLAFTVQIQPIFPAFPQTIDGQPVAVPGMPGQIAPPAQPLPGDPNAPVDPSQVADDGSVPPEDPSAAPEGDESDDEDSNQPPWLKKSYRTASGQPVGEDDFVAHVALRTTTSPEQTLAQVRRRRRAR